MYPVTVESKLPKAVLSIHYAFLSKGNFSLKMPEPEQQKPRQQMNCGNKAAAKRIFCREILTYAEQSFRIRDSPVIQDIYTVVFFN